LEPCERVGITERRPDGEVCERRGDDDLPTLSKVLPEESPNKVRPVKRLSKASNVRFGARFLSWASQRQYTYNPTQVVLRVQAQPLGD
jgi:hypothetical protein